MKKSFSFLTAAAILVVIFGTMYGVSQQVIRQSANDPQIQIAEDTADKLRTGANAEFLFNDRINISSSLAPFVVIYNRDGNPVGGDGYLDGALATAPKGMLTSSENKPYHAITWQPSQNVRIASVTVATDKYYVVAGRSLKEIEPREDKVYMLAVTGGVMSIAVLAIRTWLKGVDKKSHKK
jgi:hypothetical protein